MSEDHRLLEELADVLRQALPALEQKFIQHILNGDSLFGYSVDEEGKSEPRVFVAVGVYPSATVLRDICFSQLEEIKREQESDEER